MQAKAMLVLVGLLAVMFSGCAAPATVDTVNTTAPSGALTVGDDVTLRGAVVDTVDACAADGICAYVVETDQGRYTVVWAEGMSPCQGQVESEITVGDNVEVLAQATAADTASICASAAYFVRAAE